MEYLFWYFIVPMIVSFLVQSVLCRKVKRGIVRQGTLILPIIYIVLGVIILLTQSGDTFFGGLGAIAAALWFISACCAACGYGAAWLVYLITKKGKNKDRKERCDL